MDEDTKLLIKSYTAFWIVLTLILAAFLFVKDACAATPFIEIGQSKYEKPPCGLWHQECADYGVDWNMKPSMFRIGFGQHCLGILFFHFFVSFLFGASPLLHNVFFFSPLWALFVFCGLPSSPQTEHPKKTTQKSKHPC